MVQLQNSIEVGFGYAGSIVGHLDGDLIAAFKCSVLFSS